VIRSIGLCWLTIALTPFGAYAQGFTSTFVGSRGLAGSASFDGSVWTVNGGGADVWDRSDAFQFLHTTVGDDASITARVDDLANTSEFAKAGVMVRASTDPAAAMAILDIRPGGQLEFMARTSTGDAVNFISGPTFSFPAWLSLSWSAGSVRAWVSHDGQNWSFVDNASVALPSSFEAGVAVTSHDTAQITTAHVESLTAAAVEAPAWASTDVGSVAQAGAAAETNGVWTSAGGGADIWGTSDAFHYVYRPMIGNREQLQVRVTDLQNTSSFAKAGLMIRTSLSDNAATLLLDVRPTGDIELLTRSSDGAAMQFLGGTHVSFPVWLRLSWVPSSPSGAVTVTASVSQDRVTWTTVGPTADLTLPALSGVSPIPPHSTYDVGVVVSSHDTTRSTVAHFDGLSVVSPAWSSDDIGSTGLTGNAVNDPTVQSFPFIVAGSGADIWGTADSFQFMHLGPDQSSGAIVDRVDIHAGNAFAKAGFMYRDGLAANAAMVIVDLKPDGGVEFMARLCTGCAVTYLGGANVGAPAWLRLAHTGTTFSATVMSADRTVSIDLGSVSVPMSVILPGFAVTSHDQSQIAVGVFNNPPQ
jgi:hypothetical protein